jgi:hypothetical protein
MRPRRPPPYTTGICAFASAAPTLWAAVAYIASAPGDEAQLMSAPRMLRSSQDADRLAIVRVDGEGGGGGAGGCAGHCE